MTVNLLFGLPFSDNSRCTSILSEFFALEGIHIVCGGLTAQYVGKFLHKSVVIDLHYEDPKVPPISHLEGVDLVTEGIVTMNEVLKKFAFQQVHNVKTSQDGASLIYSFLMKACNVNFYVCDQPNPTNQEFPFLKSKLEVVQVIAERLKAFGKKVVVISL